MCNIFRHSHHIDIKFESRIWLISRITSHHSLIEAKSYLSVRMSRMRFLPFWNDSAWRLYEGSRFPPHRLQNCCFLWDARWILSTTRQPWNRLPTTTPQRVKHMISLSTKVFTHSNPPIIVICVNKIFTMSRKIWIWLQNWFFMLSFAVIRKLIDVCELIGEKTRHRWGIFRITFRRSGCAYPENQFEFNALTINIRNWCDWKWMEMDRNVLEMFVNVMRTFSELQSWKLHVKR